MLVCLVSDDKSVKLKQKEIVSYEMVQFIPADENEAWENSTYGFGISLMQFMLLHVYVL